MDPLSWRRRLEVADLTASSAFTLALLDDTWRWRQRIVEELEFGSSEHLTGLPTGLLEGVRYTKEFLAL